MTRKLLEKMTVEVRVNIELMRGSFRNFPDRRETVRNRAAGYTCALRDAGLITDRERQLLYIYITV